MIRLPLEVRGEGGSFVVLVRAASICRAERLVASRFPGSEVRVIFPIEGAGFFAGTGGIEELETWMPEAAAG